MYLLTLDRSERDAFEWVGGRYATGAGVGDALCGHSGNEWDSDMPCTFLVPEHVAWEINELSELENHAWPCFGPELAAKMNAFCDRIV